MPPRSLDLAPNVIFLRDHVKCYRQGHERANNLPELRQIINEVLINKTREGSSGKYAKGIL